ncbi:phosphopantothenoylcysteine decarboxylase [Anaerosporomusa subterranea]|uniref:Coenzyme A biosynthesis bifunctional protein CoaBC n=1 Tax=Anaerosporomusa subterranea TaxID=1794912 RepID=A0A154BT72_ANASB|nr:bifunctional phosphopantothenoylcysteine decarboxylase/phosphopantothenate--cysteine ligase CoaBC [Anaerosporomusa subterranea]KYZ77214.1 phosphopantothenoylcysteine decarboxylase [Anaerosporomusa subterranea]
MLAGKNVVIGVTGGIAAYKAVEIVSLLRKAGASVHVIMTQASAQFVTPLTFREMSGNPVAVSMWDEPKQWHVAHIALATLADIMVIAPATANIIGKIANGIADDMLSTTVMATQAPILLAPAMNTHMYQNPIVQNNLSKLANLGYYFVDPESGLLACGTEGPGRLAAPGRIVDEIAAVLSSRGILKDKKVIVTAGGTREPIDPVRFVGNRSSGKMGYAIAKAAAKMGANVVLISGPVSLPTPQGVRRIDVETAAAMRDAVLSEYDDSNIVIKAAAVADYRPKQAAVHKIKKTGDSLVLELEKNPDILSELGQHKQKQVLVGFAAETQDLLLHAQEKLTRKNLDMIVANDVTLPGAGFNTDTNIAKLIFRDGHIEDLPLMSKDEVALVILNKVSQLL